MKLEKNLIYCIRYYYDEYKEYLNKNLEDLHEILLDDQKSKEFLKQLRIVVEDEIGQLKRDIESTIEDEDE